MRDAGGLWLAAGNVAPADLPVMPELQTRLGWGLVFQLQGLNDTEKRAALAQHAEYLGFRLEPQVADYLLNHTARDMQSLLRVLEALDRFSLETRRPITLPLLRQLLRDLSLVRGLRLLLGDVLVDLRHVQPHHLFDQRVQRGAGSEPASEYRMTCSRNTISVGMERIWKITGQFLFDFGVDLGEDDVGVFFGCGVVNRRKSATGATPWRPEIDDDNVVALDGGFKIVLGEFDDGHAVSCEKKKIKRREDEVLRA